MCSCYIFLYNRATILYKIAVLHTRRFTFKRCHYHSFSGIYYYLTLSTSLAIGMFLFGSLCLFLCYAIETYAPFSLWLFSLILFIVAWIGQFYGHKVEGKKPSFIKDIQFLLIGPLWLASFVYKKMGIKY